MSRGKLLECADVWSLPLGASSDGDEGMLTTVGSASPRTNSDQLSAPQLRGDNGRPCDPWRYEGRV